MEFKLTTVSRIPLVSTPLGLFEFNYTMCEGIIVVSPGSGRPFGHTTTVVNPIHRAWVYDHSLVIQQDVGGPLSPSHRPEWIGSPPSFDDIIDHGTPLQNMTLIWPWMAGDVFADTARGERKWLFISNNIMVNLSDRNVQHNMGAWQTRRDMKIPRSSVTLSHPIGFRSF